MLQLDITRIKEMNFIDGGIAFHSNLKELPICNEPMRINVFVMVGCKDGKLQTELNGETYTITKNELIVCRPNMVLDNWMFSHDYSGMILCLSPEIIMNSFSDIDVWNKGLEFSNNPVIRISEKSMNIFDLCGEVLKIKINMEKTSFHKEIIQSTIKAALYEFLSNVDVDDGASYGNGLLSQREVLFRNFIKLMVMSEVKPRNVKWYAEKLCVSPRYLSTICKTVSGRTAFDWINRYVQTDIQQLLKTSDKSVKEISEQLEFPNISFFSKYCRQHFGASPTELKKKLRQQSKN